VGREQVACALLAHDKGVTSLLATRAVRLESPLFNGAPTSLLRSALARALAELMLPIRGRHVPVHLVVPDALARSAAFELEEVPANATALERLVQFRLGKELGANTGVCVSQSLGEAEGRKVLLGATLDAGWLELLRGACADAGIVPWTLGAAGAAIFNSFETQLAGKSGALVALSPDAWALWAWDANGLPRPLRAQWRGTGADESSIAAEVERTLIAFTDGHESRAVERLAVWPAGAGEALASVLDERTGQRCERWSFPATLADAAQPESPAESVAVIGALIP